MNAIFVGGKEGKKNICRREYKNNGELKEKEM